MKLNFTKMHGLGNDFVVLDFIHTPFTLNSTQIQSLANRKLGIGCDQVLLVESSKTPDADFNYRIFNADGSVASHCGNGARSIIKYLYTHYNIQQPHIRLSIAKQVIIGQQNTDNSISIDMGLPKFTPNSLPFLHQENVDNIYTLKFNNELITFGIADVGNPHVLIEVKALQELNNTAYLTHLGQLIQQSDLFPDGINVNFYTIINKTQIQLRTYERGCGFTSACGTGATATISYLNSLHLIDNQVTIIMPGGSLNFIWDGIKPIIMTGPAIEVFTGQIELCD